MKIVVVAKDWCSWHFAGKDSPWYRVDWCVISRKGVVILIGGAIGSVRWPWILGGGWRDIVVLIVLIVCGCSGRW